MPFLSFVIFLVRMQDLHNQTQLVHADAIWQCTVTSLKNTTTRILIALGESHKSTSIFHSSNQRTSYIFQ